MKKLVQLLICASIISQISFAQQNSGIKKEAEYKVISEKKNDDFVQALLYAVVDEKFKCGSATLRVPAVISDLNQTDKYVSNVTSNLNVDLNLFGIIGAQLDKKDILLISDFIKYKDYHCDDNSTTRVQVGIRLYIHIRNLSGKISATNLPKVCAAVELGKATAEYHLQIFGLDYDYDDLPASSDLDVEHYAKIISAFDKIVQSLKKDTKIDPLIIKIP